MRGPLPLLLAFLLMIGTAHARADIYVVVNNSSPVQSLSRKDVIDLFMGRARFFANGAYDPMDMPRGSDERTEFYQLLAGLTQAQVNSFWARLIFTGQTVPPQQQPDDAAMLDAVEHNPRAIGYVRQRPAEKDARVVLVLKQGK